MLQKRNLIVTVLVWFVLWGLFQGWYALNAWKSYENHLQQSISNVMTRISLDVSELPLANPRLKKVANKRAIERYLVRFNQYLLDHEYPISLRSLQGIEAEAAAGTTQTRTLSLPRQDLKVEFVVKYPKILEYFSTWPPFVSLLIAILYGARLNQRTEARRIRLADNEEAAISKLVIDLNTRELFLTNDEKHRIELPNKPFCFYVALLDYSSHQPESPLYHNKDLPEEFLNLTNKYFYRLMELGHTRRKRPDFSSNIDKMLSEIRAALDEIFEPNAENRGKYYPKKAQGEGSRSKLHDFSLENLTPEDFELIGR